LLSHLCTLFTITYLKQTVFCTQCSSWSVFTVCATCNVISPVQYVLYLYISTSRSLCEVPIMASFCSSLVSCLPGKLLRYCLNHCEMVPVALLLPVSFCFHILHVLNFFCKVFIYYNLLSCFFHHISVCRNCNIHRNAVPCLLQRIPLFGLW